MKKSIIVIGAGMGGLAAGIYGRMNGYETTIFEQHNVPGGQCASWTRKGYTFDACIHHFIGSDPGSKMYGLWRELGVVPRELARTQECVSVASPEGKMFNDYYDVELLEEHLKELSPRDGDLIERYAKGIPRAARKDVIGEALMGTRWELATTMPSLLKTIISFRGTMLEFASRFTDPFLRSAFPLLEYSNADIPFFMHVVKKAHGYSGNIAWPVGASRGLAGSMEKRYTDLGGEVNYRRPVEKILVEGGRAVGVRLEDGSEHRADVVVSNADGRRTIMEMLDGRFTSKKIREECGQPEDETNWAVHVFLGVTRDLSNEPSALVQLLEKPLTVANHTTGSVEMQMYGFDRTMAPEGKGVIKVELVSQYSYWKQLYADRSRYNEEKEKVAEAVIDILESTHFPGLRSQIEVVDVPTLMTWERFMGGTHGFMSGPARPFKPMDLLLGERYATLPGLDDCYLVGTWATAIGALWINALSGRRAIQAVCEKDGRNFQAG